jgi:hypothetical protein
LRQGVNPVGWANTAAPPNIVALVQRSFIASDRDAPKSKTFSSTP